MEEVLGGIPPPPQPFSWCDPLFLYETHVSRLVSFILLICSIFCRLTVDGAVSAWRGGQVLGLIRSMRLSAARNRITLSRQARCRADIAARILRQAMGSRDVWLHRSSIDVGSERGRGPYAFSPLPSPGRSRRLITGFWGVPVMSVTRRTVRLAIRLFLAGN